MVLDKINVSEPLAWLKTTGVGILLKGQVDQIEVAGESFSIVGGNAGMTKGGTGDVLSGLVAGLYCAHDQLTTLVVASYINKRAGEVLFDRVGPYFNATDLANTIPEVLWSELAN